MNVNVTQAKGSGIILRFYHSILIVVQIVIRYYLKTFHTWSDVLQLHVILVQPHTFQLTEQLPHHLLLLLSAAVGCLVYCNLLLWILSHSESMFWGVATRATHTDFKVVWRWSNSLNPLSPGSSPGYINPIVYCNPRGRRWNRLGSVFRLTVVLTLCAAAEISQIFIVSCCTYEDFLKVNSNLDQKKSMLFFLVSPQ